MKEQFKTSAKSIIDALFDAKSFREDITRNQMQALEDYIAWSMGSAWDNAKRCEAIIKRMEPLLSKESADQTEGS